MKTAFGDKLVCGNPDCKKIFIKHNSNQKYCCEKCRNKVVHGKHYYANKNKILSHNRAYKKIQSAELGDVYVKRRLQILGIENPSNQDIELKRIQSKLKRKSNEKLRQLIASGNNDSIIRLFPSTY